MALTAARTELNVSLVGEDETIRMLEDAKKRMAELEAKTRSLTGATKAQTDAAKAQQNALEATNGKLVGMAKKAEGVVEGVDKVKGAFEKVIGVAGFLGSAVTGVVTAITFLTEVFGDSEEEAAKLTGQLDEQKRQMDATKEAADRLAKSLANLQSLTAGAASGATSDAIKLAQLSGDMNKAAELTKQQAMEQAGEAANKTRAEIATVRKEAQQASDEIDKLSAQSKSEIDVAMRKEAEVKKARRDGNREEAAALAEEHKAILARNDETQKALRLARATVTQSETATEELNGRLVIQEKITEKLHEEYAAQVGITEEARKQAMIVKQPEDAKAKPRGGGGGGPREQEVIEDDITLRRAEADEIARVVKALYEEQQAREANEAAMLSATKLMRDEVGATLPALRQQMKQELATLPGGALFEQIRKQLEEQVKAVETQMAEFRALANVEDADLLAQATDKQVESLSKLQQAYLGLGEARSKAFEESARLAEQLERENLAGYVSNFSEALQGLGDIQTPVFEAVTQSLSGITAQMEKFKGGQQTLTQAVVGSGAAIAAAVAKQVNSVRVEAGIRALFETAMGFANLGNPAVATGHFTAAAMFGLVAGGVIPTAAKTAPSAGGQKAPAKEAATKVGGMDGGGGGQVTNVYNLNTGIVDGQSTAMAFRRAEMQARNTGMASAGGW